MHHVDPHGPRACHAEDRVEVCSISVDKPAGLMDEACDLQEVFLEKAEGVGVGQHQARHPFIEIFLQA